MENQANSRLLTAAREGDLALLKELISARADVNATSENGETAVMLAATEGHAAIVQYLAEECGADVNATDNSGWTALIMSAGYGHLDIVRYLTEVFGVDVNAANTVGATALMVAASNGHIDIVRYLAEECGAEVNATPSSGSSALINAAWDGHLDIIRYLAEECGADVDAVDKYGVTALIRAAYNGHVEIVRYLAQERGADVNFSIRKGKSAAGIAADRGDQEMMRILKPFLTYHQSPVSEAEPPVNDSSSSWVIPPSEIALTQLVDTNNVGGEYLAKWLDADVVIKLFIPDATKSRFKNEVQLWQKLRHPNVIKMYGACEADLGLQFFVCEYASGGSLIEYITSTPEEKLTIWKFLFDTALGLEYLHERGIVHGSLRCSNILIGSDGLSKLSNFTLTSGMSLFTAYAGSVRARWHAPEVVRGYSASLASDVYSLGMCILEAVSGSMPWVGDSDQQMWNKKGAWSPETGDNNDYYAPNCPNNVACDLIWRMCCQDPAVRINIESVVNELERLVLKEGLDQSQPESEPLFRLNDYQCGKLIDLWSKIHQRMTNCDNTQYCQVFDELESLYERLESSAYHITLLTRFHELIKEFYTMIAMNATQVLAICLSSSRATTSSVYTFYRRIQSLRTALGQSTDGNTQRDTREELIVTGVSDVYLLLRELSSDDEKAAFLNTLNKEMAASRSKYSFDQLKIMKKAVDIIERKLEEEGITGLVPEWFIPWYELIVNEGLEDGGFGKVSRAKWLDSDVVVKHIKILGSEADEDRFEDVISQSFESSDPQPIYKHSEERTKALEMFRREVGIWFGLSHPHVIRLFGACHVGRPFFVCEYATNGTLVDYLRWHPNELWQKLHETAFGVQYLHARNVVHGDLKGNNIVVGSDMKAKVTDFGLSSLTSDAGKTQISAASHWVAPEGLTSNPELTFASDVYSLGMCIVEAMRVVGGEECSLPWGPLANSVVRVKVKRGELPPRPSVSTDAQWELITRMCVFNPAKRIKISTVVDELEKFVHMEDGLTITTAVEADVKDFDNAPDIIAAARAVLTELHNNGSESSLCTRVWDRLEGVYSRIANIDSTIECRQTFSSLVKSVETATDNFQKKTTMSYLSSVEATMQMYSLCRRLSKFEEAYLDSGSTTNLDDRTRVAVETTETKTFGDIGEGDDDFRRFSNNQ